MNVAQLFARNARRAAASPALAHGGEIVRTHGELAARAARLAAGMNERFGLAAGERVAIFARNAPEYVELLLACWWGGFAPVPVNARLHPSELAWILEHCRASLLFASEDLTAALGDLPSCLRDTLVIGSPAFEALANADPREIEPTAADHLAWLFYTSGTTGRPKGAMITHRNLRAMTYAYFVDVDGIAPGDAIVHAAPLSHGSGLYILPHAAAGAVQVVPESGGFDPAELFALLPRWPGTTLFAAPTMVNRLVDHARRHAADSAALKTIVYGGAPMYLADLDAAHEVFGFKLAQIYGQGESPMTITALDKRAHADTGHPRWRERLRSAGTPQIVCEVRIADEEGRTLPEGEVGEILVRGDSVVPGYWEDPGATARTMGDGWLRTGDLGTFDGDGFLYIKDRSKDLIISGGANIYPREVEDALLTHPGVREVSVIGIPDREWGERVVACVVAASGVGEEELDAWCLARIARFKRPRRYLFLDALPKNAYGKILKRELRARLTADPARN